MLDAEGCKIGRIVHTQLKHGECRPAIVVKVWSPGMVNLQVFADDANYGQPIWRNSVQHGQPEENTSRYHHYTECPTGA